MDSEVPARLIDAVADEIMAYLRENSAAGDTPRGIWRWWLTEQREQVDVAIVEQALDRLVADGRMGRRVLASGVALYFGVAANERGEA